jgi:glycosyltransferase involved in cell wall biosynthesis
LRLLIDCTPLSKGGGVQVAIAFLVNLRARAEVSWVAVIPSFLLLTSAPWLKNDYRVIAVSKNSMTDRLRLHFKLKSIEKLIAPDVVFTIFGPTYFRARASHVVGFALPRLIYDEAYKGDSSIVHAIKKLVFGWIFRQVDHVVVETHTVKDRLVQRIGICESKISVIGNSVNPILLNSRLESLSDNRLTGILVPSSYYAHKNLEVIPHVASAMKSFDSSLSFEFRLTLPKESKEWSRISAEAVRLGVGGNVVTLGNLTLEKLADAYSKATCVFLPTLLEASSAVYPESFWFRRPLITSDLDFARELCGNAALYVNPNNINEMARSIINLITAPETFSNLIEAGEKQLRLKYPSATSKFDMQMAMLESFCKAVPGQGTKKHERSL